MKPLKSQSYSISLQAVYWMVFCSIHSYAAVFLTNLGFASANIGLVVAISSLISVFLQPLVGAWIDKDATHRINTSSVMIVAAALIASAMLLFTTSITALAMIFYMFGIVCVITLQPIFSALILQLKEKDDSVSFGVSRAFGSLAFAGASTFIGTLVEKNTATIIPWVTLSLLALLFIIVVTFPRNEKLPSKASRTSNKKDNIAKTPLHHTFKRYPAFTTIIFGLSFIFIFHSMANVFLINIVQAVGGSERQFGFALTLMAMVEIPVMIGSGVLIRRFGTRKLFAIAMIFYAIRSAALMLADNMTAIYFAQLLQAFSFALYIPVSVAYVGEIMGITDRVKGQTLTVSATTLGSVAGSMLGGIVIDGFGVSQMLLLGFMSTVIGAVLVLWGLRAAAHTSTHTPTHT